jgi:hypothetical protein
VIRVIRTTAMLGVVACAAAGCAGGGEWLPEYSHDDADAQGLYPAESRWKVRVSPDARRTLGDLLAWKKPAPVSISGLGIVVGLDGTGDHDAAVQGLVEFWRQRAASGALAHVDPPERPGSAALVMVTSVMPADGPPTGAVVRPVGNAFSLEGGRLITTALRAGGEKAVLATAEGPLFLSRVLPDGSVVRDTKAGRVPRVVPRRRPDARRLEFVVDDAIPGTETAARSALEQLFPGARVWSEAGPPRTLFVALPERTPMPDVPKLLQRTLRIRVGEPGIVVVRGGADRSPEVELLGPPAALGTVHLRVSYGIEAKRDEDGRYVRLIGVPRAEGHGRVRKGLVEFEAADGRRIRVVTSNELADLLPVLDRTGLPLRNLASALQQARDAGAIGAILRVDWAGGPQAVEPHGR